MSTSRTAFKEFYGLQKPFNFKVAIPFLLSISGLILVLLVCTFLLSTGGLRIGTERFYFFAYIIALLVIASAFSRITAVSLAACFWCVTELGLALASSMLATHGIGTSLFPSDSFTERFHSGFAYHPLLGWASKPNWRGGPRFDRRNKDAWERFWPVNAEDYYREAVFSHNALGLRGRDLSTNDLQKDLIFALGGSSTYDWNVTQGSTWVERLELELHHKFTVVNFGVPAHSTAQHLIHTAFYQNILNKRPVCAIYYIGWNDLLNLHVADLDPGYANAQTLRLVIRKSAFWTAKYSPLALLVYTTAQNRFDTIPSLPSIFTRTAEKPPPGSEERLERIFVENIRTIAAINSSRGVKTIFIGQVVNRDLLKLRPDFKFFSPFITSADIWPMHERFNLLLKSTSALVGANYIDAGIGNFTNSDFADVVHFSAAGSKKFAELISERVENYCQ